MKRITLVPSNFVCLKFSLPLFFDPLIFIIYTYVKKYISNSVFLPFYWLYTLILNQKTGMVWCMALKALLSSYTFSVSNQYRYTCTNDIDIDSAYLICCQYKEVWNIHTTLSLSYNIHNTFSNSKETVCIFFSQRGLQYFLKIEKVFI